MFSADEAQTRRTTLRWLEVESGNIRIGVLDDAGEILESLLEEFQVTPVSPGSNPSPQDVDLVLIDAGEARSSPVERLDVPVLVFGRPSPGAASQWLEAGAADYLPSTISEEEFAARIRRIARRTRATVGAAIRPDFDSSGLRVWLSRRQVEKDGRRVRLTPNEFRVLQGLISDPGAVLSHRELIQRVWGVPAPEESRHYLRIYVTQLRLKLEDDPRQPSLIETVWGRGYRINVTERRGERNTTSA